MNAESVEASFRSALVDYRGSVLDELQTGAVRWSIVAVAIAAGIALLGAISVVNPLDPRLFLVIGSLFVAAGLAELGFRYQSPVGAVILVAALLAAFAAVVPTESGSLTIPWLSVIALIAAVVLGWRLTLLVVLAAAGILLVDLPRPADALLTPAGVNAILLCLANLFIYTLTGQPFQRVLRWTWSSYLESLERTHEARERQAELARLSKSLGESYYRLEQLNLELERARRTAQIAQRLKEQFAAAVSHELRTPLNLIIGFCEMMVLSPESAYGQRLPSSYRSDLEAIYRNSCHISNLIDDILDLSQIDAGRMALHREWTTLHQIVDEAVATVETLFRDRELILQVMLPRDLPSLFVDRTRIRQILINWLANAVRFTEQGGVTIQATTDTDSVVVTVRDTGPGIPPSEQALLFEEFHQVGQKRWQQGGSGLGLAVSKRFAELHGGATWVESTLGQGSTFFLKLPLVTDDDMSVNEHRGIDWNERVATRVRGRVQPHVLVVDDAGQVRKVFERYLDDYQIVTVDDVLKSHEAQQDVPVHAVVLGSEEALGRWRALQGDLPDLQDVLLVSCPLYTPRRVAEDLGVGDYLVKPVSREQLQTALQRLVLSPRTALIVDDNPEMNRLLVRMVRSLYPGCDVWSAEDGQRAIEILRDQRPDVVLLDLLM
ncbi:MAG: ATP-binding protein, partial [Chloroflexota bacterium]